MDRTAMACNPGSMCPTFRDNALSTSIGQRGTTSVMRSHNNQRPTEIPGVATTTKMGDDPPTGTVQADSHREEGPAAPNPIRLAGVVTTTRQANNSDDVRLQPQQHDTQQSATLVPHPIL
jgi:hypothetical protein